MLILKTTQCTCNALHRPSHKYIGFHNLKRGWLLHSPTSKAIPYLGVFSKHHGLNYFSLDYQRGIAYDKEYSIHMHYSLVGYPRNTLGSKTYLLKLARVLRSHTRKPICH